jgi:hypothetical protein
MTRRDVTELAYQAIRIEGGLIPADELARLTTLQAPDTTEQTETHYSVPRGLTIRDEIGRYWKIAQNLWADFQQLRQRGDVSAHEVTVREFLVPLMRDVLGFTDVVHGAVVAASGHSYNVGYSALGGLVPLVLVAHSQALDEATELYGELNMESGRIRRRSPFTLVQEALNASDGSLWAIVSNGLTLRILRDNPSLTRPAYIEVDLEALFAEELYADFTAFWLLTHASRFGKHSAEPADCPWERWRSAGQEAGSRARDRLRGGVALALRALGTGFLSHPANSELRDALQNHDADNAFSKQAFFDELLRLVYRLIFLATIEDRVDATTGVSLVFTPDTQVDIRERYLAGYSLTMLRTRAARRSMHDTHSDLWQALSITFDGLAQGEASLGLPALGGLFDAEQCQHIMSAQIENRWLLTAIFRLGYFRESSGLTRVNYRDMGPEELGSVYESLLELVPNIQNLAQPHTARLAFVGDVGELDSVAASTKGNTRKLTGSYYTPDSLVQELIKSALEPVIAETLSLNPTRPIGALLEITVCDPACGSGHFLLAAARRLADEVAKHRAQAQNFGGAPTQADYRHALREVTSHCIFGVDKNPMAIALAKTALWLEAYTPDLPLSFLDHHIQCGDALLGVLDPKILENGIPDQAFAVLSGDDKATAAALKKQNKADLKSWEAIAAGDLFTQAALASEASAVEQLTDDSLNSIAAKRKAWMQAKIAAKGSMLARLADTYVAAFLMPKIPAELERIPLSGYLWGITHGQPLKLEIEEAARVTCQMHSVFHWWLAFPQVAAKGGFTVMLGNPPWERIKLQEEEFFAARSPLVAMAQNKARRGERIELLRQGLLLHTLFPDVEAAEGLSPPNRAEMRLHEEFIIARRGADAASLFAHDSGRYPLTGVGDVNTYALFAETLFQLVSPDGRAGFIVPTGIATDDSTKAYFEAASQNGRLIALYSFENEEFIFPAVHHAMKFCLMVITGKNGSVGEAQFIHFARQVSYLSSEARRFTLTPDEFNLINPNTRTCPVFRSQRDAELTKKLYRQAPVLIAESLKQGVADVNPWGIRFSTMFHMSNDSGLFRDAPIAANEPSRLPLYEAKMIHQFDHRWATYVETPSSLDGLDTKDCTNVQKSAAEFTVRPRYWVDKNQVLVRIALVPSRVKSAWLAAHMDKVTDADTFAQAQKRLMFAVASWVAGEHFFRNAGPRDDAGNWSVAQQVRAMQIAEIQLAGDYKPMATILHEENISGKKALTEFNKWASQDVDVRLNDIELSALSHLCLTSDRHSQPELLLELLDMWMDERSPQWLMGWRDITNATNERTVIASVISRSGVGNNLPLMLFSQRNDKRKLAALLGNLCSLVFDFVSRHKVGGTHLNFFIYKQLPVQSPERYTEVDLAFIIPRVLELTYSAQDIKPWAEDLGFSGPPFAWNTERRAQLRAELDAYYAHLYDLNRDELRYILDPADVMGADYPSETFRVLKNSEMRMFGEYRTQRLVLDAWDRLARNDFLGLPYELPVLQVRTQQPKLDYSGQGFIRNEVEGRFAGLVLAMLKLGGEASGSTLQAAIETASMSDYVAQLFDAEDIIIFRKLVDAAPDIFLSATTNRLNIILLRLENFGTVFAARHDTIISYRIEDAAVPNDVIQTQDLEQLAGFILKLDSIRRARLSEINSQTDDGQDKKKSA